VEGVYLTITVQAKKQVTGLSIWGIDRTMCTEDVMFATVQVEPADHDCTQWQYYSTDTSVFDVLRGEVFEDDMGRLVLPVESYAAGTANLVVRALDGSGTECVHTITVQDAPTDLTIYTIQELPEGSNSSGFFAFNPPDALFDVCEVIVADTSVANVTYDSTNGDFVWYAKNTGTTTLTVFAYCGNAMVRGSCTITVRDRVQVESIRIQGVAHQLYVGETAKMYYTVLPEGHDCTSFSISSDKPSVADFDRENAYMDATRGHVIPVEAFAAGTTRLNVMAGDGSGVRGTFMLQVLAAPESISVTVPSEIVVGQSVGGSFKILPEGVTYDDCQVSSTSSMLDVQYTNDGSGEFTCIAKVPGTAMLEVLVRYGNLSLRKTVRITVVEPVYVTSCEIVGLKPVMNVGEVLGFYLACEPEDHDNDHWSYSCSNTNVANFSLRDAYWDDSIGGQRVPVTAYAQGVSEITVKAMDGSGTSATWRIVVLDPGKVKKFTLPDNLRTIDAEAFMNVPMEYLVVNNGCATIGERAFANCGGLLIAEIPASVTSIASSAFEGCSNLTIVAPTGSAGHRYAVSQRIPWLESIP